MGSINSRPLKAFVRFDGSGRIVAGSLILRKNKPKVGKWKEIPAYECCNPTTTTTTTAAPTTTTTTSVAPTTTTTTSIIVSNAVFKVSASSATVCAQEPTLTLYYVGVFGNGTQIFTDEALTTPYLANSYISNVGNNVVWFTNSGETQFTGQICS